MNRRIRLPNGETEVVRVRYKIPGKNRGFLCVCESLNCYVTFRGAAVWVMDERDYDRALVNTREKMLFAYSKARQARDTEAFAAFIMNRMEGRNGKERSLD